jgi:hypothetical protein
MTEAATAMTRCEEMVAFLGCSSSPLSASIHGSEDFRTDRRVVVRRETAGFSPNTWRSQRRRFGPRLASSSCEGR